MAEYKVGDWIHESSFELEKAKTVPGALLKITKISKNKIKCVDFRGQFYCFGRDSIDASLLLKLERIVPKIEVILYL